MTIAQPLATASTSSSSAISAAASPTASAPASAPAASEAGRATIPPSLARIPPAHTPAPAPAPVQAQATSSDLSLPKTSRLQLDAATHLITSQIAATMKSVNADMVLEEGITLDGTHYGLNLISTKGVVLIAPGARILPSSERQSRIVGAKVVVRGEAVVEHIQGDEVVYLSEGCKVLASTLVYGQSLVTADSAQLRIQSSMRKLATRERRASHHFDAHQTMVESNNSGFDDMIAELDKEIDEVAPAAAKDARASLSLAT